MLKAQKNILVFLVLSVVIVIYSMYRVISSPSDETGHAIGLFIVSSAWLIVVFVPLFVLFIKNLRVRFARYYYGGLILMLPAIWFYIQQLFFQIFYSEIIKIHPSWEGRVPDLNIIGYMILFTILFLVGLKLIMLSKDIRLTGSFKL